MKEVSVILPVRNGASTITRAIQSIQEQTFEDWELIVVDDGSEDETPDILKELAEADRRIKIELRTHRGIVDTLNHGIHWSQGRYIARMDADDVSKPDRLLQQVSFLDDNKEFGLVGCQVSFMGDTQTQRGYASHVDWTNSLVSWDEIRRNRFVESPFAHPSVVFRRALLSTARGPYAAGAFPEDYELWLRWMDQGVKMAKLPSVLLEWYDPPGRLSRNSARYSIDAFYQIKSKYLALWLRKSGKIKRPIWIWGAGRVTRKRASQLKASGIGFAGFIDIDPKKTGSCVGGLPVVQPDELPFPSNPFVLSYVGNRGAREDIRSYLLQNGLNEEADFTVVA